MKRCPVCGVENTGGRVHGYHNNSNRKRQWTIDQVKAASEQTRETNAVRAIVSDAVDEARRPSRAEYHRLYYKLNLERRRKQRREQRAMYRKLKPLISALSDAVDLARVTAQW